jgi:signal transduction histidine kinase
VILTNYDYLVEESKNQEPDYLSALHDSQNATRRIMRLLENLLDVSRLEERRMSLRRTPTPLAKMLSEIAGQRKFVAEAMHIVIQVSSSGEKTVQADADLLTRAVENVFDNALRYTPAGGRIEVVVEDAGHAVNLRIGNTGAPIPKEFRTAIFDKYSQSATASGRLNMGLGLYFCRLAAEAHGGRIWVEETNALPTVFVIQLPV